MPPRKNAGFAKPQNTGGTLKRIFSYMYGFKPQLILIVFCIVISVFANVAGNYMLRPLIDKYIEPFIGQENPDLSGFVSTIIIMVVIYLCGALSTYIYQRIMVNISTTTLFRIRTDLFNKMESLPVRYFDKHTHGELMSLYTNDADAIREMLSNSVAQFISSSITVISVFTIMVVYSWQLTILVILMLFIMLKVIGVIGKNSSKGFKAQQESLGNVNGYIEEFIEGQKVVKVFCHEDKANEEFNKLNDKLCQASTKANTYANILMPIMNN